MHGQRVIHWSKGNLIETQSPKKIDSLLQLLKLLRYGWGFLKCPVYAIHPFGSQSNDGATYIYDGSSSFNQPNLKILLQICPWIRVLGDLRSYETDNESYLLQSLTQSIHPP